MSADNFTTEFSASFRSMLRTYEYCMQSVLNKYGLYPGQPQLLFAIRDTGSPSQNQLAAILKVSKASVGVSLRRMENAGFVRRIRDKDDTRCIRIALTKQGEDFARWCEIDFEMLFTTMLQGLESDQREITLYAIKDIDSSLSDLKIRLGN
ncbi:MAG: MarR family winged helix-turn-helix transcriptional regulator [Clostridia bacterium]